MLSDDLTRSQSELYAAWRGEQLSSPLRRLWIRLRHRSRSEEPAVEPKRSRLSVPAS